MPCLLRFRPLFRVAGGLLFHQRLCCSGKLGRRRSAGRERDGRDRRLAILPVTLKSVSALESQWPRS
ncbi:hypothetical protein E2C01_015708 [Portunus trituberculatus]|uniref:Uncharacterized protein n=1 Tax=Portunus trituberculatus TaxID=210409 RepID=A0A5B7DNI7_PORTR|nr:hypothetical protein [Portunus trituberculatus]